MLATGIVKVPFAFTLLGKLSNHTEYAENIGAAFLRGLSVVLRGYSPRHRLLEICPTNTLNVAIT